MPGDTAPRYQRERLTFWVALFVGLGLLYWSSETGLPKFWEKLSASVGEALILACVIDFFFKGVRAEARLRDHQTQDEFRKLLGGWGTSGRQTENYRNRGSARSAPWRR
jgi:hypothetical protein